MAKKEIWKAIPGHNGYEVSNQGRARSVDRVLFKKSRHRPGLFPRRYSGKILAIFPRGGMDGKYLMVHLGFDKRPEYVHRLVMSAFIGRPTTNRYEVHHIDHNTHNNHLSNLKYVTRSENNFAIRRPKKEKCYRCGKTIRCYDADLEAGNI
jgi:hypothetical protein